MGPQRKNAEAKVGTSLTKLLTTETVFPAGRWAEVAVTASLSPACTKLYHCPWMPLLLPSQEYFFKIKQSSDSLGS